MEDKFKRISKAQLDIWVDNPVTKTYLQCLDWSAEQCREVLGSGHLIDSTNNDKSMNAVHSALGEARGYEKSGLFIDIFNVHKMLEEEDSDDTNN